MKATATLRGGEMRENRQTVLGVRSKTRPECVRYKTRPFLVREIYDQPSVCEVDDQAEDRQLMMNCAQR